MNIQCKWSPIIIGDLLINSYNHYIGYVTNTNGEPTLHIINDRETLTFTEIEHIMDNWENLPKI